MVTEFNPLEPIKHMDKQLLPIYVLQQLPSALPSTAPAGGEATEKSLCTHTFLFLWAACGLLAGWESLLQVIKRATKSAVPEKCSGDSVSGCFKIEGKIQMLYLL